MIFVKLVGFGRLVGGVCILVVVNIVFIIFGVDCVKIFWVVFFFICKYNNNMVSFLFKYNLYSIFFIYY